MVAGIAAQSAQTPCPRPTIWKRMAAVRALVPEPRHVVTGIEARLGTRYTAELIAHLTARHPGVRFVWIMGADGLWQFSPLAGLARDCRPCADRRDLPARTGAEMAAGPGKPRNGGYAAFAATQARKPRPLRRAGVDIYHRAPTC